MKKVYISADIEGTCGIVNWEETEAGNAYSDHFRAQMTAEVAAACRGALAAGADEIVVKDAHDSARNIYPDRLPKQVKLIRAWSRDPYSMMTGLDESFDAVFFTGYHSASGTGANPLSHTMSTDIIALRINGALTSEFNINSYIAEYFGVPSVLLTGDRGLCDAAKEFNPGITTVPVSEGRGGCSLSVHPARACELIEEAAAKALSAPKELCRIKMPEEFDAEVQLRRPQMAYRASFYPGARLIKPDTVGFKCRDFLDFLKFHLFAC